MTICSALSFTPQNRLGICISCTTGSNYIATVWAIESNRFASALALAICQSQCCERHAGEAEAEFLQRPAPGDRLGHVSGQFIEFVVHNFPFVLVCVLTAD